MTYTCQNCGVAAGNFSELCNPVEELKYKLCFTNALPVCEGKVESVKYSCNSCGSVSANTKHLCIPREIIR